MTTVLTVNPGSHSLRLHVIDSDTDEVLAATTSTDKPDAQSAAKALRELLDDFDKPVAAVGHRLVHGGPHLRSPTVVDDSAVEQARTAAELAPSHVPITLDILSVACEQLPDTPHVLCPDTAFHAGLPDVATTYAIPEQWRQDYGIRRYGFHGLSYAWATARAAELLNRPADSVNLLLAHLGGGCSVCAVRDGSSVDTSMGFTPLDGVPMSTRSGGVDPGMLLWLLDRLPAGEVADGLYHRSGLLGLSGSSSDTRDLVRAATDGDDRARLAMDVFTRRVSQALAAMAVTLPRLDALVFTGEIGWDQPEVRQAVCQDLARIGVPTTLPVGNPTVDRVLSSPFAPVLVLAVEPREELQIARETSRALVV
ncbi:acetate kinase [Actinosynnema sp. ALI-1.44]|uniref:acetate/propionate family kinase n=1 Tax=Actinosynnema sp. ALI-1.44 TaxID=1933779 RepID=UPI00097BCB81|nr:acetate/propionate family kinase [Actinosynnema sp. ALI-1.44]ONI89913.1 acetate kinase [Actinosynnema sp. ALI-1.44]